MGGRIMLQIQEQDKVFDVLSQIHDGQTHIGEYLGSILKSLPIAVCWKDSDSIYQGCNAFQGKLLGFSHPDDIIGKNDFDFKMYEEEAEVFRLDDQQVMLTGQPSCDYIRSAHYITGLSTHRTTKFPIYDDDKKVSGVAYFFYETALEQRKSENFEMTYLSNFFHMDLRESFRSNKNYYIIVDEQTKRLTIRQAECLTYLSIGKTTKQISNIIGCSSRTVEEHINTIKRKLGVCFTTQLIDCFWHNPIKWF